MDKILEKMNLTTDQMAQFITLHTLGNFEGLRDFIKENVTEISDEELSLLYEALNDSNEQKEININEKDDDNNNSLEENEMKKEETKDVTLHENYTLGKNDFVNGEVNTDLMLESEEYRAGFSKAKQEKLEEESKPVTVAQFKEIKESIDSILEALKELNEAKKKKCEADDEEMNEGYREVIKIGKENGWKIRKGANGDDVLFKGNIHIWQIRDGWQVAELKNGRYQNHKKHNEKEVIKLIKSKRMKEEVEEKVETEIKFKEDIDNKLSEETVNVKELVNYVNENIKDEVSDEEYDHIIEYIVKQLNKDLEEGQEPITIEKEELITEDETTEEEESTEEVVEESTEETTEEEEKEELKEENEEFVKECNELIESSISELTEANKIRASKLIEAIEFDTKEELEEAIKNIIDTFDEEDEEQKRLDEEIKREEELQKLMENFVG